METRPMMALELLMSLSMEPRPMMALEHLMSLSMDMALWRHDR